MRYVIGIGGLARSGKDSFARALRDVAVARGLAFVTVAYADALRDAAAAAYGVDVGSFVDDAKKDTVCPEWGITYRQMLINLGEAMRAVDPDHWVKAWRRKADDYDLAEIIAVPDVRRLNEAAAIHDVSGVNVLVRRPGVEWNGHVTEALSALGDEKFQYDDRRVYRHHVQHGQQLTVGTWYPRTNPDRSVFDAVVDNDADVAALRPHAERVLDMVTKGNG